MVWETTNNPIHGRSSRWPSYQPMVLVTLGFASGILLDRLVSLDWRFYLTVAWSCLAVWYLLWYRFKTRLQSPSVDRSVETTCSCLLLMGVLSAGAFWHQGRWDWFGENEVGRFAPDVAAPVCLDATVNSEPRWSINQSEYDEIGLSTRTKLTVEVNRIRDGGDWKRCSGKLDLIIHQWTDHVRSGDRIRVFGRLVGCTSPSNPGQFDFRSFYRAREKLAFLHVYQRESAVVVEPSHQWSHSRILAELRHQLNGLTVRYIAQEESAFASAILLGNREQMSRSRRDRFLETGTIHLLAISGLHVGILAGAFFLFFRLGWFTRKKCLYATILFVIFYAWLVEFRPPVTRAAILVSMFCVGRIWGETSFSFNLLAIAGMIVLLLNPSDLFGVGPQLSFLAVGTLTFGKHWVFWPPSRDPIKRLIASTRPRHIRGLNWMGRKARTAFLVSGLIWMVAMPLVAYRFHLVAPVSLVINPILLVPIALALYGGLGVMVSGWGLPPAARISGWICDHNLAFIEWLISVAQAIPGGHFWTAGPSTMALIAFYGGLFVVAVYPPTRLPGLWIVTLGLAWLLIGWVIPGHHRWHNDRHASQSLTCTFVDVGHGTAVLLQLPSGQTILYDCGSFGSAEFAARSIAGVLWSERINHLDAVIISHADSDHYNALPELVEKFSIGRVLMPAPMLAKPAAAIDYLMKHLHSRRIAIEPISAGNRITSASNVELSVLGPPKTGVGQTDNSNSVVLLARFAGRQILLPGDLEKEGLARLLNSEPIDCDVVMAPHHGSEHSLPKQFMEWAKPEIVVISGGAQRIDELTVQKFSVENREIARTDRDGAIRVLIQPESLLLQRWKAEPW